MPVYRVEKNSNYTVMSNCHLRDPRMTWKAKGLLSYILSLPGGWDFSAAGLAEASGDGISATRSALKELETSGYLIRRPIRTGNRISDWEYIIYEEPRKPETQEDAQVQEETPEEETVPAETGEPSDGGEADSLHDDFLQVENLKLDSLMLENRTEINTKGISTKGISTEKDYNTFTGTTTHTLITGREAGDQTDDSGIMEKLRDAERVVSESREVLKKDKADKKALADRFDRWWEAYPRKVAKKAAEKVFEKIAPDDALTDAMIAAVRVQMEKDSRFRETQYTPHPATWLSGEQWKNDYSADIKPRENGSSFDADEFFDLALKRSYDKFGVGGPAAEGKT